MQLSKWELLVGVVEPPLSGVGLYLWRLPAMQVQAGQFTSLGLHFLTVQIGIIIAPTGNGRCEGYIE